MPPRKRSNWRQPTIYDEMEGRRTTRAARSGAGHSSRSSQQYATKDGVTINVSRSKEPVKQYVEVWRTPGPGIGFAVPMWVQVDKLTAEEKEEYVALNPDMAAKIYPPTETPQDELETSAAEKMQVDTPTAAATVPQGTTAVEVTAATATTVGAPETSTATAPLSGTTSQDNPQMLHSEPDASMTTTPAAVPSSAVTEKPADQGLPSAPQPPAESSQTANVAQPMDTSPVAKNVPPETEATTKDDIAPTQNLETSPVTSQEQEGEKVPEETKPILPDSTTVVASAEPEVTHAPAQQQPQEQPAISTEPSIAVESNDDRESLAKRPRIDDAPPPLS